MTRLLGLSLLIAFALSPALALAKDDFMSAEAPPATLQDDIFGPDPAESGSQEVTEVVTSESMPLPPVEEPARKPSPNDLNGDFGLRRGNLFPSEWAAFWRLSSYSPTGDSPASGALYSNLGLRYKTPDRWGEYYQLAYEASYNFWNGSTADIQSLEFAIEAFAAGSPVFRMEHHPYYGIGIGNAEVNRRGAATFNQNIVTLFGGIEFPGRRVDYDVFVKYVYGPDSRFNMDDVQVGLGVVYTFGRGR